MDPLPKVVIRDPVPEGGLYPLDGIARVQHMPGDAPRSDLIAELADAAVFMSMVFDRVDPPLLDAAPRLVGIANCAAGFNNIDIEAAKARGLWVTNTPDVLTDATADLTMGLILAVTRRFREAETELRTGGFRGWSLTHMLGMELRRKTLGILGFGRIGQAVARRAIAFGMRILYTDRRGRALLNLTGLPVDLVQMEELFERSHVISVHVPLSDQTRHLIDDDSIARMRRGAYLINTARGPIVDEAAVARALVSGHLAGAGLDVFEKEPDVHPELLAAPNAVLLPHIGSATEETRHAMASLAAENAAAMLRGKEPPTPVVRGGLGGAV
jgi:glyoxylate reductase